MFKVKISYPFNDRIPLERQLPSSNYIWNDCKFYINQPIKDCDLWIVYDNVTDIEQCFCPKNRKILITSEPPELREYKKNFTRQFNFVFTSHKSLKHKKKINYYQFLPWLVGASFDYETRLWDNDKLKDFNYFLNSSFQKKEDVISVILSDKKITKQHKVRLDFVELLKERLGSRFKVYGVGIKNLKDKLDILSVSKYSLVLENSSIDHYWTEKLGDAFLSESFPFYYGAPNIGSYFDHKSMLVLKSLSSDSIEIIEDSMNSGLYERRRENLLLAKNKMLFEYNIFPFFSNLIRFLPLEKRRKLCTIRSRQFYDKKIY